MCEEECTCPSPATAAQTLHFSAELSKILQQDEVASLKETIEKLRRELEGAQSRLAATEQENLDLRRWLSDERMGRPAGAAAEGVEEHQTCHGFAAARHEAAPGPTSVPVHGAAEGLKTYHFTAPGQEKRNNIAGNTNRRRREAEANDSHQRQVGLEGSKKHRYAADVLPGMIVFQYPP